MIYKLVWTHWREILDKAMCFDPEIQQRPLLLRARTIKGYGLKATEMAQHGGHGFPFKTADHIIATLEEIYGHANIPTEFLTWAKDLQKQSAQKEKMYASYQSTVQSSALNQDGAKRDQNQFVIKALKTDKKVKAQGGIGEALIYCREKKGWPVVSVSADLQGSTGVLPFRKKFPDYSFDMGVAEANMISVGSGFSKQGFIPVVDTFSQFGVTKGALPLFMANLFSSTSDSCVLSLRFNRRRRWSFSSIPHLSISNFCWTYDGCVFFKLPCGGFCFNGSSGAIFC